MRHRTTLHSRVAGLLLGVLACLSAVAAEDQAPIDLDALDGDWWYGVYVYGHKSGHAHATNTLDERDGVRVFVERVEMQVGVQLGGESVVYRATSEKTYEADPPYRLISVRSKEGSAGRMERLAVVRQGDDFVLTRVRHGRRTTRRIPASRSTLRDYAAVRALVASGPAVDDSVTYWVFDEEETLADKQETGTVTDVVRQQRDGHERTVVVIEEADSGMEFRLLDDGTPLRLAFGKALVMKLEDEATARRLTKDDGVPVVRERIPVEGLDVDGEAIAELVLAVSGLPVEIVTDLPTQRVTPREDGTFVLTLTAAAMPQGAALTDDEQEQLAEYLKATDELQTDDPRIREQALKIVKRRTDPAKKVWAIARWVHRRVKYVEGVEHGDYATALDVLIHLEGNCSDYALLCVALCRAAGVPAREAGGLVYAGPRDGTFAFHDWVQVYIGEWVNVDPTFNQFPADATHLVLDDSERDLSVLLAALPDVQIDVVNVRKKSDKAPEPDGAGEAPLDLEALDGEWWYGATMHGRKVGHACVVVGVEELDGVPVLFEGMRSEICFRIGDELFVEQVTSGEMYEVEPPYRLIRIVNKRRLRGRTDRLTVDREGDEFVVTRVVHGRKTEKRVPASRRTLRDFVAVRSFVAGGVQVGDSVMFCSFDEEALADESTTATVVDVVTQQSAGVERRVVVLEDAENGIVSRYLEDGTLLEATYGEEMRLRLEDEATARQRSEEEVVNLRREVPVDGLGSNLDGEQIAELAIVITGLPDKILAELPRQRLTYREDGSVEVVLQPAMLPDHAAITDEDRARLADSLASTAALQADHRRMQRRARRIVGRRDSPVDQAHAITRWVHRHVEGAELSNYETALDVLVHLEGDCTENTLLFVALCRAASIPAREVSGLVYSGPSEQTFAFHAWAQVYLGEWVDVDPTLNQFPADATHLRFNESDAAATRFLGACDAIRIDVLRVTKRSTDAAE